MMIADNAQFNGADRVACSGTKSWTLPVGAGPFYIYAKFRNALGQESKVYSDDILPQSLCG
jgi:hypothetical protein